MKKIIYLLLIIVCITGCTKWDNSSYISIINQVLSYNTKLNNNTGKGFKYYLPKQVILYDTNDNNSVFLYKNTKMYMYVDVVSYYNKSNNEFMEKKESYYSKKLDYNDKFGYLEINKYKSGYFVEMMYHYGKIETFVKEEDINDMVYNMTIILSSISYNDTVISSLVGKSTFNYKEEVYNIFTPIEVEDNYLIFEEDIYDDYEGEIVDEDKLIIDDAE